MDERYMSRKFMLATFVILAAVPLLVMGYLDKSGYITITGSTLGLYFTGNVVQKFLVDTAAKQ